MAKIVIKTDPKTKPSNQKAQPRNWKEQPSTLKEWKTGATEGRDWKKQPLTVEEIRGWTAERKKQQEELAKKMYPSPVRIKKPAAQQAPKH